MMESADQDERDPLSAALLPVVAPGSIATVLTRPMHSYHRALSGRVRVCACVYVCANVPLRLFEYACVCARADAH